MQITTIGLDLAKSVFQVHGVDADGQVIVRKKLRRAEAVRFFEALRPCLVGIEACATREHLDREALARANEKLETDARRLQELFAQAGTRCWPTPSRPGQNPDRRRRRACNKRSPRPTCC